MKIALLVVLAGVLGCSARQSPENNTATPVAADNGTANGKHTSGLKIIRVPRPNSGTFTTEQATELLPQCLARSVPIPASATIVTEWASPTQGIRIHLTVDDNVEIVDYFGRARTGVDSIDAALDSTMTHGNERSVLLTSDSPGWDTPTRKSVVDKLFEPSVQIYIVTGT